MFLQYGYVSSWGLPGWDHASRRRFQPMVAPLQLGRSQCSLSMGHSRLECKTRNIGRLGCNLLWKKTFEFLTSQAHGTLGVRQWPRLFDALLASSSSALVGCTLSTLAPHQNVRPSHATLVAPATRVAAAGSGLGCHTLPTLTACLLSPSVAREGAPDSASYTL